MSKVYIAGYMPKEEFFKKATFHKKGDLDPGELANRDWRFSHDCYLMNLEQLNKLS